MDIHTDYRTITREQFLFHEMRIVAKLLNQGMTEQEVMDEIAQNNLFQYPTERMIRNLASVCLKRFKAVDSNDFIDLIANGSSDTSRQACLFLMMNYYRLVWDFMIGVIGEKYRTQNDSFTKLDLNAFFTRLQEQNDTVASWSDSTIQKCKQVLKKILVENGYLDSTKSEKLNPVFIDWQLIDAIEKIGKKEAFIAFNEIQ